MANQFCVGGDSAASALTEDTVQPHYRHAAAGNDLTEYSTGADRGELIRIADQHKLAAVRYGAKQMIGKIDVHHGHLIHHDQIGIQHLRFAVAAVLTSQ